MKNRLNLWILPIVLMCGCASANPGYRTLFQDDVSAVHRLIEKEHVSDARFFKVRRREYLAFDMETQAKLGDYSHVQNLEGKRQFILNTLKEAKTLGDQATELEMKRVSSQSIDAMDKNRSLSNTPATENVYARIFALYQQKAAEKLAAEINKVLLMKSQKELDRYFKKLISQIKSSIKTRGRTLRQILMLPLSPFIHAWMGYHILTSSNKIQKVDFRELNVYRPQAHQDLNSKDVSFLSDGQLLEYYAPVIAMEKKEKTSYDPKDNQFGKIVMEGSTAAKAQPRVNVEEPVVYAYSETKIIQKTTVKLLVYTLWFPERPKINGVFDPEVGSTQGSIIRIALNKFNQPLIYENVSSCGCYYKVFPTQVLETRAREKFQTALKDKHFVIENQVPRKMDANVPSLVENANENSHLIAIYSSGTHEVLEIRTHAGEGMQIHEKGPYKLIPYEELENLPFQSGTLSLFDQDGLVRNADRLEATLLAPSGIYHAGTPRQRGTLMIYFDQADFDDPHLLEIYLRLPENAFERKY